MFIERVEGLAEVILRNFHLGPPDAMVVFSARGVTANPIEMAMGARRRGLPVIAVTSVAESRAAALGHSSGTRLLDHADVVIDLGTPVGDALVTIDGLATPVGPGSSVTAVAVVNEIKVRTADLLVAGRPAAGADQRVGGGRRGVGRLFDAAYDEYARRLARVLTRARRTLHEAIQMDAVGHPGGRPEHRGHGLRWRGRRHSEWERGGPAGRPTTSSSASQHPGRQRLARADDLLGQGPALASGKVSKVIAISKNGGRPSRSRTSRT